MTQRLMLVEIVLSQNYRKVTRAIHLIKLYEADFKILLKIENHIDIQTSMTFT